MFKRFFAVLIALELLCGAAFAVAVPSPSVTSPIIADSGAGGNYYYLFVPDQANPRVRVFRAWTNPVSGTTAKMDVAIIDLLGSGGAPGGMVVNKDATKLYVSLYGSNPGIAVYDINKSNPDAPVFTFQSKITAPGMAFPAGLALSPDGFYLYAADSGSGQVYVIRTYNNSVVGSINVGVRNLFGVAVKPDGTRLAVSVRNSSGAVHIYDISGVPSSIPRGAPLYSVTSGMEEPTYLVYSSDELVLYVKVNQRTSPYNDILALDAREGVIGVISYGLGGSLSIIVQADEEDPKNQWDGLALSPDENFLYITHYRTSIDPADTADDGLYGYVVKKSKLGINMKFQENSKGEDVNGLGWRAKGPMLSAYDAVSSAPNGGRIWFTYSYGADFDSTKTGTGYTDDNTGEIKNTPPSPPQSLRVEPSGAAATALKWNKSIDDGKLTSNLTYIVEYKTSSNGVWLATLGNTPSLEISGLDKKLPYGTTYYFRVKAFDGIDTVKWDPGLFSAFATIGPVTVGTSTGGAPTITKVEVKHGTNGAYVDITAAPTGYVWDTVKVTGSGFSNTEGKIYIAGIEVPASAPDKVYGWKDTEIEFGIPRYNDKRHFVESGKYTDGLLIVSSNGQTTKEFTVKPLIGDDGTKVWGLSAASGAIGSTLDISGASFGNTGGASVVRFYDKTTNNLVTAIDKRVTERVIDGDPTDADDKTDRISLTVPSVAVGKYLISVISNKIESNKVDFEVKAGAAPTITGVSPNAAPNTADITVTVNGTNFLTGTTVALKMSGQTSGQTDISGTVTFVSSTNLSVLLPITGKTVGKWDVVVTNSDNQSATLTGGFTVLDSTGTVSQIIDDFEGTTVTKDTDYTAFTGGAKTAFSRSTAEKKEGSNSMSVQVDLSATDIYGGYYGYFTNRPDISKFTNLYLYVKSSDTTSNAELRVELQDLNGKNFAAVDSAGKPKTKIAVANSDFTKYSMNLSDFVEVGTDGKPVPNPATLDLAKLKGYQVVIIGSSKTGNVYIDFIAAGGTGPVIPGQATFSLYYLATGNQSWISTPFAVTPAMDNTVKLGGEVASTFPPAAGDSILIHKWDNSKQQLQTTSGDYDGAKWIWDPVAGNSITAGEMFKVNVIHGQPGGKVSDLVLKGTNPSAGAVQFDLYNLATGNANWISIPLDKTAFKTTKDLGDQLAGIFTPATGDSILIHKWDNSKQQLQTTSGDYDGAKWIWDLSPVNNLSIGEPYITNLSHGPQPFSVKTKF